MSASKPIRLGAVSYLNTRPLVYGLDRSSRFAIRFDVPSRCADLLHEGGIDVGLIPSIEYLRGGTPYWIAPGVSLASRGAVDSVALYSAKPITEVRSIALDVSSRTSVALVTVLCARLFHIKPRMEPHAADVTAMLANHDAALVIGDNALFLDHRSHGLEKIDLGEAWFRLTGLPFVYAFWAGRPGIVRTDDVVALTEARDAGVARTVEIAETCYPDAGRRAIAARYLRDNMKYELGDDEAAGLRLFFAYASDLGLVRTPGELRFYP